MRFISLDLRHPLLVAVISTSIPVLGAASAWYLNQHEKRAWEAYVRKEENYKGLLAQLPAFYVDQFDPAGINKFIREVDRCWLYCPDDVIEKAYAFLATVHTESNATEAEQKRAVGELVAAIRQDILSGKALRHTHLTGHDYPHLGPTEWIRRTRK